MGPRSTRRRAVRARRLLLLLVAAIAALAGLLALRPSPEESVAARGAAAAPSPRGAVAVPARPSAAPTSVPSRPCGAAGARTFRFRVSIDRGVPVGRVAFARDVRGVLCHERSWIASGAVRFRYDPKGPLLIGLRTPDEAERRCLALIGLSVRRYYSCARPGEVVINADRWLGNSRHFPAPLAVYRRMLVNHEVGHALGLHHQVCARQGALAPVMMQQSKGLTSNGKTCRPNPWPLPEELERLR